MKKTILTIIAMIFLVLTTLNTYAQDGCCYEPGPDTCVASDQADCDPAYWSLAAGPNCNPAIVPECTPSVGCCTGDTCKDNVQFEAECPGSYQPGACQQYTECQEGCCFCITDPTDTVTGMVCHDGLTEAQCITQCSTFPIYYLNKTLQGNQCETSNVCAFGVTLDTGTITGFIRDENNNPLGSVTVTAAVQSATSASDGYYTLSNLPSGSITVRAELPGYETNQTIIIVQPGTSQEANLTIKQLPEGTIYGTVIDSAGPVQGVTINLQLGPIPLSPTITDAGGYYEFTGIPQGQYTLTAEKLTHESQTVSVNLPDQGTVEQPFTLIQKPFGKVSGTIKDNQTDAVIPFAQIIVDSIIETRANSQGYYEIDLPVTTPATDYSIKSQADGYFSSLPQQITIQSQTYILDFKLDPIPSQCANPAAPSIVSLTASHIKGEQAVELIWEKPNCHENMGGYTILRQEGTNIAEAIAFLPVTSQPFSHPQSYIDENIRWDTTYTYHIIITYTDGIRNSTDTSHAQTITTGDQLCEGKFIATLDIFSEFCQDNNFRRTCDDSNQIIDALDSPVYCDEQFYYCAGPDFLTGKTSCKFFGPCDPRTQEALPFGLYHNEDDCIGSSNENYCYFDNTDTIIDACYACYQEMDCADYKSHDACIEDNCLVAENTNCAWQETEYSDLGKGFCYEVDSDETAYCSLCSSDTIFQNLGCTEEVCGKLGDCYSSTAGCSTCDDNTICDSYTTQSECTGDQEIDISSCSEQITSSNDRCNLGACKWDTTANSCYKDGNDDDAQDCALLGLGSCKQDTTPPTTALPLNYIVTNKDSSIEITSDIDAAILTYCIDKDNTCCPSETINFAAGIANLIPFDSSELALIYNQHGHGEYHLRYYAVDNNQNQEQLKSSKIYLDLTPPKINIDYIIIPITPDQPPSDLIINISTDETVTCTDSLTETATQETKQNIQDSTGDLWSVAYTVDDGYYDYTISCTDNLGNTNTTTIYILVDAWPFINIVRPDRPDTIKDTTPLFEITTLGAGTCSLKKGTATSDFTSSTDKKYHTANLALENNKHYPDISATCIEDSSGKTDKVNFFFTIDNQPPKTKATIELRNQQHTYENEFDIYAEDNVHISFECDDALTLGFGCKQTNYCIATAGATCNPFGPISFTQQPRTITQTETICYASEDNGNNQESASCSTVHRDLGSGIELISPPHGVSSTPIFDVVIRTLGDYEECKYSLSPDFDYNSPIFPSFEATGELNMFKIDSFAGASSFPYTYPMNIKCKDRQGTISAPVLINLAYDDSAPILTARAIPTKVVQQRQVNLSVTSDDATICKYDTTTSNYEDMQGIFAGWDDWQDGNPSFTDSHIKTIYLVDEDQGNHRYYIACQNRAGAISTAQINFEVDFYEIGAFTSVFPQGSVNTQTIALKLNTSRDATCYHENTTRFSTTGGIYHESVQFSGLAEGVHSIYIYCDFPTQRVDKTISFTVDITNPDIVDIDMPDRACYDDYIQPTFVAEDNLSSIDLYNYSLYKGTEIIIDWTTTASDNPRITQDHNGDDLNLSFNEKYYFSMNAMDAAGNWGDDAISSNEFELIPDNSSECYTDDDNPTITIQTAAVQTGIEVTMSCTDESGCDGKYYGTSESDEACNASQTYTGSVILSELSKFCWEVSDTMNNTATGFKLISVNDEDGDGVPDNQDTCPGTPYGSHVDLIGCPVSRDDDNDGVPNIYDICSDTPVEESDLVDADGCAPSQTDTDDDGVQDTLDQCPGTPFGETVDTEGCSDSQKDSDEDGMDDAYEKRHNLDPFSSSDADEDTDSDKLTNYEEYTYFKQTGREISPREEDTDGDGYSDKDEIDKGYNPVSSSSYPRGKGLAWTFIILGLLLIAGGTTYIIIMNKRAPPTVPTPTISPTAPPTYPSRVAMQQAEKRRRMRLEVGIRRKQTEKRRAEIISQRRAEKARKRSKLFEAFGVKKAIPKKLPPKLPPRMPTLEKEEFERLAELTKSRRPKIKIEKAPLDIKKAPPKKESEFERLQRLIETRKTPPKKLKLDKKHDVKDLFDKLSKLKEQAREKRK
ncbi:MAG: carboxypeptidase regulatory-like domain-containing protein [Candidatus Woesearchaeota archaeon]